VRSLLLLPIVAIVLGPGLSASPQRAGGPGDPTSLVVAVRRTPPPAAEPVQPPSLTVGVMRIRPLTFTATIERRAEGRTSTETHVITRARDRMHVQIEAGREWLFQQNPVDGRRVSGALVDHATRTIVVHDESDLRRRLGLRGWADVVTFGIDDELLARFATTADARTVGGIRFTRYDAPAAQAGVSDVWWNRDHALPGAFTVARGLTSVRFSVSRIGPVAKREVLAPSRSRYPDYRVIDLADWVER
jgi:hypothetical protein